VIVPVPAADPASLVEPTEDQQKALEKFIARMTNLQRQRPYEETGFPFLDDLKLWTQMHAFLNANPTIQIRGPNLKTNPEFKSLLANVAMSRSPNSVPLFQRLLQKKPEITATISYPIGNGMFLPTTIGGILKHYETDTKLDKVRKVYQDKIRMLASYEADKDRFVASEIAPIQIVDEPAPVVGDPTLPWPEVACIVISTHGSYVKNTEPVKSDASNLVTHIKIPAGMTLDKITAVGPGCINWVKNISTKLFLRYGRHIFQTSPTPEDALLKTRDLLRRLEETGADTAILRMIKDSTVPGKPAPTKESMERFRYRRVTSTAGEETLEKWFGRSEKEAKKGMGIHPINGPPGDLFPDLVLPGKTWASKSEILRYFAEKGTRHVIIIDFTCGYIENTDPETKALFREYAIKTNKNGGRRKTRNTRKARKTKRAPRKTK
jgi:hypothetical protein